MILSVTFDFGGMPHEDSHLTVPKPVRAALGLGPNDLVHLDLSTPSGHVVGDFRMVSGGEIDVPKGEKDRRNAAILGVVHAGEWGVATASLPSRAEPAR